MSIMVFRSSSSTGGFVISDTPMNKTREVTNETKPPLMPYGKVIPANWTTKLIIRADPIAVTAPVTVAPFQFKPIATTGKIDAENVAQPNAPRIATSVAS